MDFYIFFFYTILFVQIVVFAWVLKRIRKRSSFATKIILLNLLSSIASVAEMALLHFLNPVFDSDAPLTVWNLVVSSVTMVLYAASFFLFNIALWLFGFHYYKCQAKLFYVKDRIPIPIEFERK